MTICVAIQEPGIGTHVACDRLITGAAVKFLCPNKFYFHDGWAIGQRGDARVGTVIEQNLAHILGDKGSDPLSIASTIKKLLEADGFKTHEEDGPVGAPAYGMDLILANNRHVWEIDCSFTVSPIDDGTPWAVGSGQPVALGAAHALLGRFPDISRHDLVHAMVNAANEYDQYCGGGVVYRLLSA